MYCSKNYTASVFCPEGHYVCDGCHGEGFYSILEPFSLLTERKDPLKIADKFLRSPLLPSLGAEHHAIVTVSLMVALKNFGPIKLRNGNTRMVTDHGCGALDI